MRRLRALVRKETLQIVRDPSAILIAFVLPLILLFIFGYGVNLDSNRIPVALVLEEQTPDTLSLVTAFSNSRFLEVSVGRHRREFEDRLVEGELRGIIVIPQNFVAEAIVGGDRAGLQVIADGSEPNLAAFVQNYARGVLQVWLAHELRDHEPDIAPPAVAIEPRFWYNQELRSRNFLLPGSIAIIMALIGTLLTALVIAREWERGTMEALMATPVSIREMLLGKLIPYFMLGLGSMVICWAAAVLWYGVPFRGSFIGLLAATSVFLLGALGQGLLISTLSRNQFVASQAAIMSAFLPALMLSGFVFEISAMPLPIRMLTYLFSARYFVTSLQTLFLAGNIVPLLAGCFAAMVVIGLAFFLATARKTNKRLDS